MKLKKKLVGGHSNYYYILCSVFFLLCKTVFASQIYDYQTDEFIKKINSKILSVNNYDKNIKFRIINDNFPNAFVTQNNTLFISSGLIIHSPDYVSFLAVLAHEIGHLEKYHVSKRIKEIRNLKKINSIRNLASVMGSMIIQQPELINTIAINQTAMNNLYLNFSQEQEKEADFYAVETLNKLNLSTESIYEFLKILEDKTKFDLIDSELRKFSTHPIFKERYEIIDLNKKSGNYNFDKELQKEFQFIKAKFIAYTNIDYSNFLKNDEKIYYKSIKESLSGNLLESLKKINLLISRNYQNTFLLETKADILLSYGYNKEAIDFYNKVLKTHPENEYVKFNIFVNSNYINENKEIIKIRFWEHQNLLILFPNNKVLIAKLNKLAKILEYSDWSIFLEIILLNKNNEIDELIELENKTQDINLKKLIKMYI